MNLSPLLELWDLAAFLNFALLESLLDEAQTLRRTPKSVSLPAFSERTKSLRDIGNADWEFLIEPLISFDSLLQQDLPEPTNPWTSTAVNFIANVWQ